MPHTEELSDFQRGTAAQLRSGMPHKLTKRDCADLVLNSVARNSHLSSVATLTTDFVRYAQTDDSSPRNSTLDNLTEMQSEFCQHEAILKNPQ